MTFSRSILQLLVLLAMISLSMTTQGQETTEDLEYQYGLLATIKDDKGRTIQRVDDQLSFNWQDSLPDHRLAGSTFSGRWHGYVLIRSAGSYRLHLHASGDIKLSINQQPLVTQASDEASWSSSEPIELDFGFQEIDIQFKKTNANARFGVFWSGPTFQLEPLSRQHLFHDVDPTVSQGFEQGRQLVHALRCQACHSIAGVPAALMAPPLTRIDGNHKLEWIVDWLTDKDGLQGHDRRMPVMDVDLEQAIEIAAYLYQRTEESGRDDAAAVDDPDTTAAVGEQLLLTTGCLACHRLGRLGSNGPFAGPDLTTIGAKRPTGFFASWLESPEKINPHHRMPHFDLDEKQRTALVRFLESRDGDPAAAQLESDSQLRLRITAAAGMNDRVAAGKKLYDQLRCDACHGKGGEEKHLQPGGPLGRQSEWQQGCQQGQQAASGRPRYSLARQDREAVEVFLRSMQPAVPDQQQQPIPTSLRVAQRGCLACHARAGKPGLAPRLPDVADNHAALASLLPAMTPPSLNGVGDKLTDKALRDSITRAGKPHRPWLQVQMPKFHFADGEAEQLFQWLVDADRIPAGAPASHPVVNRDDDEAATAAGSRLVSTAGFGCTSCHDLGGIAPPKAPLNARGPDLTALAERIRRPWYERWVRNPRRIVPNMEMPSVQLAVKGVLGDDLAGQLDAVWYVLNKPGFKPLAPGALRVVRQTGQDAGPAAVLTDVLQLNGARYIKPVVIGLANRHNVLLDLESNRLIDWWQGDVASQRTLGKTWFWETTASSWLRGKPAGSEITLQVAGKSYQPEPRGQFATELDGWSHASGSAALSLEHRLKFLVEGDVRWLSVSQTFMPARSEFGVGFERIFFAKGLRDGETVQLQLFQPGQVSAEVQDGGLKVLLDEAGRAMIQIPAAAGTAIQQDGTLQLAAARGGRVLLPIRYESSLEVDHFPVVSVEIKPPLPQQLNVIPGLTVTRLPLADELMPTGLSWRSDGTLFISSLKGRIWSATDTNRDGMEDRLQVFGDELAAPFGLVAHDKYVDVINKYALLRLHDADGDGRVERTETVASGWGHTADYHDWIVGIATDPEGNYFAATPCQQDDRSLAAARMRGEVLRFVPRQPTRNDPRSFAVETMTAGHRFPIGLARNRRGELFVTDNQGNYNPFNELNHVVTGQRYGFINKLDRQPGFKPPLTAPAIDIPHPWTRSVNGICFLETPESMLAAGKKSSFGPWEGHLVGCEYDTRRLIRMSLQQVGDTIQGAAYPMTTEKPARGEPLLGPLACAISPQGDLYIGSIRDSGWGGANNIGTLVKVQVQPDKLPAGIAEVRANPDGLAIHFTRPVDPALAIDSENYTLTSYTRVSTPAYGGPDQGRAVHRPTSIKLSDDHTLVQLNLAELREGFVYELRLKKLVDDDQLFFPAEAYYTMRRKPAG